MTIGSVMRDARLQLISTEADRIAQEFYERFKLRDGDLIRYQACGRDRIIWRTGKILSIDDCFYNQAGGFTAWLTMAPLLVSGSLGTTRRIMFTINANGSGFRAQNGQAEIVS